MYKIVIIEDEDIIRNGLIQMVHELMDQCRVVAEARNGKEGIKVIESSKPDIVLLDLNMPIMNGLEMLEALPQNLFSTIVISGQSEFEYAKKAIQYDVVSYLLKPIDAKSLKESIEKAIDVLEMKRRYISERKKDPYEIFRNYKDTDSVTLIKAIQYIEDNIGQKILMDDLVEYTKRSVTSINNRFQRDFGMTFNEYLTRLRIQKAIDLMANKELHLYEVAQRVGFADYKYFNQVFKKVVGESPRLVQTYFMRHHD